MKSQGAYVVEENAVDELMEHIEQKGKNITKKALAEANESDRTRVTYDDVLGAIGGLKVLYNM